MTRYRGFEIVRFIGKRDVWFDIYRDGKKVGDAATEFGAMQVCDKLLSR